jgi:hypothetical protein
MEEWWGLVDTGAEITAFPAFWIEGGRFVAPGQLVDPERRRLRGLSGLVEARVYYAAVSRSQRALRGPFCALCRSPLARRCATCKKEMPLVGSCARCGRRLAGHFCRACRIVDGRTAFRIAAVDGLDHPGFGLDLLRETLTVVDPWRLRITLVNQFPGRLLAGLLRCVPGMRLTPALK